MTSRARSRTAVIVSHKAKGPAPGTCADPHCSPPYSRRNVREATVSPLSVPASRLVPFLGAFHTSLSCAASQGCARNLASKRPAFSYDPSKREADHQPVGSDDRATLKSNEARLHVGTSPRTAHRRTMMYATR